MVECIFISESCLSENILLSPQFIQYQFDIKVIFGSWKVQVKGKNVKNMIFFYIYFYHEKYERKSNVIKNSKKL